MAMEDFINPYALQSSDTPGLVLVSNPLTGENYNSWSRSMKFALSARNTFAFVGVGGSFPKPNGADPLLLASWERNNDIVVSWLLNSIRIINKEMALAYINRRKTS